MAQNSRLKSIVSRLSEIGYVSDCNAFVESDTLYTARHQTRLIYIRWQIANTHRAVICMELRTFCTTSRSIRCFSQTKNVLCIRDWAAIQAIENALGHRSRGKFYEAIAFRFQRDLVSNYLHAPDRVRRCTSPDRCISCLPDAQVKTTVVQTARRAQAISNSQRQVRYPTREKLQ